jgi:glycosyltransferase involved in cell wall biosynthesis
VLDQTFSDFEILVVDDGSSDNTVDVIAGFDSNRLKLIRHATNRGAAAARNTGIAEARGRWIAFLDSDDAWLPDKLERQVMLLERCSRPVAACTTGYRINKHGRNLTINLKLTPKTFRRDILYGCTISPGSTLLVERYVFGEIGGFDEEFRRLEDWDWLLRFSERYQMEFVTAPLAQIYMTEKILPRAAGKGDPVHEGIRRMNAKHGSRLPSLNKRMQLRSSLLVEYAAALHRSGRPAAAAWYVLAALCVYPLRNTAFFRTLWRSVRERVGKQTATRRD